MQEKNIWSIGPEYRGTTFVGKSQTALQRKDLHIPEGLTVH